MLHVQFQTGKHHVAKKFPSKKLNTYNNWGMGEMFNITDIK